jgi:hypothetical protein
MIALIQTPHRFRTRRQLWSYSGFGIETHTSAEQRFVHGELQRAKMPASIRGLNHNHNHELKNGFKTTATVAASKTGPFKEIYDALVAMGIRPEKSTGNVFFAMSRDEPTAVTFTPVVGRRSGR